MTENNVYFIFKSQSTRIGKASVAHFHKHLVCVSTIVYAKTA